MQVKTLSRFFKYTPRSGDKSTIELPDPNPNYNIDKVMEHYAGAYPELSNAVVVKSDDPGEEDRIVYEFKTTLGTKG